MEEIFEKYYDSIEKLMDESEEIKTTYDAKITEEERKLGELKTQESLMVIGSKLKEEKREEIDSKNKEITDLKSAKDARKKYISDTSDSIRNSMLKDVEDKMSKFKTKSEIETARKALEDKSNETKAAQEKFENESKKVKELVAQKDALINERNKLDDLITNCGLYDNESTRNEIIEKIKSKQAEIEATAKNAIDFMDKGEELKSEKEKMEAEFNSYKPVSENVVDYEKLERLSYRTMSQTSFKLEDVKKELEDWKESKEKAKSSKSEKENSEVKEDMKKTNTSSKTMPTTAGETKTQSESSKNEKSETSQSREVKNEQSKKQTVKEETAETDKENTENKISEVKISAKDDVIYVNGSPVNNVGITSSINDKKEMFKRLGIKDEIKNTMGKSSFFKRFFVDPIIISRIKAKMDPTIVNLISRPSEKNGNVNRKIGEEIGLSISDYIKSIRTKEELPIKLIYDLKESKFDNEELMSVENQMQKYARYADQITGVQVEGLKEKRNLFERLTAGFKTIGLLNGKTEKENEENHENVKSENKFRKGMHVDVEQPERNEEGTSTELENEGKKEGKGTSTGLENEGKEHEM